MTRLAFIRICLLLCTGLPLLSAAQSPVNAPVLHVTGAVRAPADLDRAALEALPRSQATGAAKNYVGTSLWTLLNSVGLAPETTRRNPLVSMYVLAIGADGYRALFSLADMDPAVGGRTVLVAYAMADGTPLTPKEGDLARLLVPDDQKASRAVYQLSELRVISAP